MNATLYSTLYAHWMFLYSRNDKCYAVYYDGE